MRARTVAALLTLASACAAAPVYAQAGLTARRPTPRAPSTRGTPPPASAATEDTPSDLRGRFGDDVATRLLRSSDPDERLRGIERAAAIASPDSVALLVQAADATGLRSTDARAWLALARGLAPFAAETGPRAALLSLVTAGGATGATRPRRGSTETPAASDEASDGRVALARGTAAMALASSGSLPAIEALVQVARSAGPGQAAALVALLAYPPVTNVAPRTGATLTPATIELFARLGDLRALDAIRDAARSSDSATRASAIVALAEMGDERALPFARLAVKDRDPRIHAAGAEALVELGAPERAREVGTLFGDEGTLGAAVALAPRVDDKEIVRALATAARSPERPEIAARAVEALGTMRSAEAASALGALLADPTRGGDAAAALGRSQAPTAMVEMQKALRAPSTSLLALRAYVERVALHGERDDRLDDAVAQAAKDRDGRRRALGVFARVALGDETLDAAFAEPDPRVRRAAAMGALAGRTPRALDGLLARLAAGEPDATTRVVLGAGLLGGDPKALVPTSVLRQRAQSGEPDAPLAAMAIAARAQAPSDEDVVAALGSSDPIVRAHAARGLGASAMPDAVGLLARAYEMEVEPAVRRQIVRALAQRDGADASAPTRIATLRSAARLDPDGPTRFTAARALAKAPLTGPADEREVAWLRVVAQRSAPPPGMLGMLVRADGIAVPIVFDDDGYALVLGVPAGTGRLVLAPRVPSYDLGAR